MNDIQISAIEHPVQVTPDGALEILSKKEINYLLDSAHSEVFETFRKCALAVLNCGSSLDDSKAVFEQFKDFKIQLVQQERGIKLEISHAPASAFVDGRMIKGIQEHLFAVLRDIVYTHQEIQESGAYDLTRTSDITDGVFHILRNASVFIPQRPPDMVVCWGGHAISQAEYEYTKQVGYELGLRDLHICTGCGPGAMKGPMKGATIGHAKQRINSGRYLGISEPGIIAAEPPNPIVNSLVILPDIEKRLEAFVRVGHGIVVFPGGVGTLEEILYILGLLLLPENQELPFPLVFTGPKQSKAYFQTIDEFLQATLGADIRQRYRVVIEDAPAVAQAMKQGMMEVRQFRQRIHDAYYFNWRLAIDSNFQQPFIPSHKSMASLQLTPEQPGYQTAAEIRRAFSGIVAANVKEQGIRAVERYGPFEIKGHPKIIQSMQALLESLVAQNRMKLARHYDPTYRLVAV